MNLEIQFPPAQVHSPTSQAAASEIRPLASALRRAVFEEIARRGVAGATDDEIQQALGMNPSTERPRRIELWRAGLVADSGQRRPTATGRLAVVWVRGGDPRWLGQNAHGKPLMSGFPTSEEQSASATKRKGDGNASPITWTTAHTLAHIRRR